MSIFDEKRKIIIKEDDNEIQETSDETRKVIADVVETLNTGKNAETSLAAFAQLEDKKAQAGLTDFIEKQLVDYWGVDSDAVEIMDGLMGLVKDSGAEGLLGAFMKANTSAAELEQAVLLCAKAVSDIKGDAAHDDVKFVVEKVGELSDKDYNDFMKITGIYMELNREKAKTQKPAAKPNPFRK